MADYRIYYVDGHGSVMEAAEFFFEDDAEALAKFEQLADGRSMELWCLDRQIKVYKPEA